jgi:purine-nucleoside phosphorylase
MAFRIPLPSVIKQCTSLVLLPQLSLKERLAKEKKNYFTSGPKLFDCFIPLLGKNGEIIISPFLGHVGVCTLLEQILIQSNLSPKLYFFGTCGALGNKDFSLGDLVTPKNYYIEEKQSHIELVLTNQNGLSLISTSFLSEESFQKFNTLNNEQEIELIDMELSFLWRTALKYNQDIISQLLITDIWTNTPNPPQPKNPTSFSSYEHYLQSLLNLFP